VWVPSNAIANGPDPDGKEPTTEPRVKSSDTV
jgi:hypothetical protein